MSPDPLRLEETKAWIHRAQRDLRADVWRFRYPGAPYEPRAAEAVEAMASAEAVVR